MRRAVSKAGRKRAGRKTTKTRQRRATRSRGSHAKTRYWSGDVTRRSDALDLETRIFRSSSPRRIALSLKHSAERSRRRKGTPYQSAMSMLTFYINRAGRNLPSKQKSVLQEAKQELRKAFGRA